MCVWSDEGTNALKCQLCPGFAVQALRDICDVTIDEWESWERGWSRDAVGRVRRAAAVSAGLHPSGSVPRQPQE